jgi:hypothetical protein
LSVGQRKNLAQLLVAKTADLRQHAARDQQLDSVMRRVVMSKECGLRRRTVGSGDGQQHCGLTLRTRVVAGRRLPDPEADRDRNNKRDHDDARNADRAEPAALLTSSFGPQLAAGLGARTDDRSLDGVR